MLINDLNDEDIVEQLKNLNHINDNYSFNERQLMEILYKRYYSKAYNLARYYGLRHNDAEDTIQDVFIKLFRAIKSFRSGNNFKPWFYKIILNKVRDRYNYLKKLRYSEIDSIIDKFDENKEIIFEKFQLRDCLNSIINKIPEKFKNVLILHIYGELDYKDISEVTGISSRQVYNRLNKAYELIKKELESEL